MKHNMGKVERVIRIILGVGLFLVAWFTADVPNLFIIPLVNSSTVLGLIFSLVGLIIFATGATAYCPINALTEHNSCEACRIGETHSHLPV